MDHDHDDSIGRLEAGRLQDGLRRDAAARRSNECAWI